MLYDKECLLKLEKNIIKKRNACHYWAVSNATDFFFLLSLYILIALYPN